MQETWLIRDTGNADLVLFMLGWAATPNDVRHITPPGCDVLAVCDYREMAPLQPERLARYRRIYLFAWSFGVWAAEQCCRALPLYRAVALNGTPFPVHAAHGMHPRMVRLTVQGLSRVGMEPFNTKTYGTPQPPAGPAAPRSVQENAAELQLLAERSQADSAAHIKWHAAYIAQGDEIFPPAAQRAYWESAGLGTPLPGGHYPFADPQVVLRHIDGAGIDKHRVGASFARHYSQYDHAAVVQRAMAARLHAALHAHAPQQPVQRALEIGIGTGFLTRLLAQDFPAAEWWFNDLAPEAMQWIPQGLAAAHPLPGDAEELPLPQQLDLLASSAALQWFNRPADFMAKARGSLRPGGILALTTFAHGHFHELSATTGSSLQYPTPQELSAMAAAAGFTLLHAEDWQTTLSFPSVRELLDHLRQTGVNGTATRRFSTPASLRAFGEAYARTNPSAGGTLPLTYHAALVIARA